MSVAMTAGGETTISDETLAEFRGQVRGEVLTPADPGYSAIRPTSNAMYEGRAPLAVRCSGTGDVVAAVNFARDNGLLLAVRGGGHSIAGLSSGDGAMLIDLSPMNGVHVDVDSRLGEYKAAPAGGTSTARRSSSGWPRRAGSTRTRVSRA